MYYGLKLSSNTLIYFFPFAVLTVVYIVPFLGGFQKNLRRVSYLKIFLVAIVWSGVTSTIPLIVGKHQYDYNIILLFIQRMLFILVLILPFEIRDMQLDFKNLKTLPQKIGIEKTKKVGFIYTNFFFGILESAEETHVSVIHGIGLSNNLKPVVIFPNGSSLQE